MAATKNDTGVIPMAVLLYAIMRYPSQVISAAGKLNNSKLIVSPGVYGVDDCIDANQFFRHTVALLAA